MNEKETGGPAFPRIEGIPGYGESTPVQLPNGETGWITYSQGMTLRDYFAAKAMQGQLSFCGEGSHWRPDILAGRAYLIADAMLKERNK